MGLDTGFVAENVNKSDIPSWVKVSSPYDTAIELVYFRKCWGIRNEIINKLHGNDNGITKVEVEDIIPIVMILMKYLDEKYYNEYADSIWEYNESIEHIKQSIINLIWLKHYIDTHSEIECYFYDSH